MKKEKAEQHHIARPVETMTAILPHSFKKTQQNYSTEKKSV